MDEPDAREPTAPPTVPGNPSPDTRGAASTSTSEGPPRPKFDVPPDDGESSPHAKRKAVSEPGVSAPGSRVDDEHEGHGDKRLKRQE